MLFVKIKFDYFMKSVCAALVVYVCAFVAYVDVRAQEDVVVFDDVESISWGEESDAPKSIHNLLRIKFSKSQKILSKDDYKAIEAMIKILPVNEGSVAKVKIKSFANGEFGEQKARQIAMQRMLNLRQGLVDLGFDISNTNFFVFGNEGNKQGLDYIDIDKY